MKKLFLIDGMALIYRSFYAFINNPLSTKEGFPTSAIYGFLNSISKILSEESPEYIAIAMDTKKPTFRHEMYDLYKANRKKMPDELSLQIPEINKLIEKSGISLLKKSGYEADDIIATIANSIPDSLKLYIVTGDKDIMQLVNDNTFVYSPGNKFSGPSVYDTKKVLDKWGVEPNKICDLLSIMGDGSDNIPGVKGVGPKTASKLINQFGSVKEMLNNIDDISNLRIKNLIESNVESVKLSNRLVELDNQVPVDVDIEKMSIDKIDFSKISNDLIGFEMPNILNSLKVKIGDNLLDNSIDTIQSISKKYVTILNDDMLSSLIDKMSVAEVVSFDLETTEIDPMKAEIVGISFSFSKNEAYYIPIQFPEVIEGYNLSLDYVLSRLRVIFESKKIAFVGQNIKYDCIILRQLGIAVKNIYFDTMIAAHLVNPIRNVYNINELSLDYLGYQKISIESLIGHKSSQIKMFEVPLERIKDYACEDADITFQLYEVLKTNLEQKSLIELFDKGILNAEGKDVVVIGGGDTAMDCVRTSIRQKAKSVKCLYRRDKENMPGSAREVSNAEEEGIEFVWLSSPKEFKGKNKIESLIIDKIQLGDPDESGRRRPEIKEGANFEIKADMVIKALGFDPEDLPNLFDTQELQVSKWGTIKTDFDTMETNLKGVFAAGDIVRGASLVVWAIKDGREAASSIQKYLETKETQTAKVA